MPCYHPMVAEWKGEYTSSGKKKYVFVGSALDPRYKDLNQDMIQLPCGQCIGCRLDYSRKWADRMILELAVMKKGLFATLTYDDDHIEDNSLSKTDHQNFMKEIRRQFPDVKIRFFMSGEYGEKKHRRHMHYILYGLDLSDFPDRYLDGRNELGQPYYRSNFFESKIWKKGRVCLSNVSWETCAYVARYTLKKLQHGDFDPEKLGLQKEFSLMSRRPGIGSDYFDQHWQKFIDPDSFDLYQQIHVGTKSGSLSIPLPEYFLRKIENVFPDKIDEIKRARKMFAEDKTLLKLYGYEKRYDELLKDEEYDRLHRSGSLLTYRNNF